MDARSVQQWIVAIIIVAGVSFPVFAGPVYTYRSDLNLPIPSPDAPESEYEKGWMIDAVIDITDHFIISDLDVSVTLTHESLFDLQVLLQSPAGTDVVLNLAGNLAFIVRGEDGRLTSVGGSGQWYFDDEAEVSIEEATEPFFGSFRSVWNLSLFDGEDAYGLWRLRIYDAFYDDAGYLNGVEMVITVPEPVTVIFLLLGTCLVTLCKPCRYI
jgi:subtilisin-like proprotein convertase family protein